MNIFLEQLKAEKFLLEVELKARAEYTLNTTQQVEVRILQKRIDIITKKIKNILNDA